MDKVLDFHKKYPYTWDDINQALIVKFIDYLEKDDLNKQTIQKLMKDFKKLIKDAGIEGIHDNFRARDLNYTIAVGESDKSTQVYLTTEELQDYTIWNYVAPKKLLEIFFLLVALLDNELVIWEGLNQNGLVQHAMESK